jgi:hypothetical protein
LSSSGAAVERQLLGQGFVSVNPESFDRERAIFFGAVLDFIRDTQPKD